MLRPRSVFIARLSLAIICVVSLTGCDFLRGYAGGRSTDFAAYEAQELPKAQMGAARFVFDDFGALNTDSLETNAVPWKVVAAALVLEYYPREPATEAHLRELLTSYGFIFPRRIANWPIEKQPQFRLPLGLVSGPVQRAVPRVDIEVGNLSCASCHSGVTYDATGDARPDAWLGLPNTSLDLDAYVNGVLVALRSALKDRDRTFKAIKQLFPDVADSELRTLEKFVWPRLSKRMAGDFDGLPFRNGGPGRSNGVEALKYQLHLPTGEHPSAAGVSIPAIGDMGLRWSVLADGIYTRRGDPRFQARAATEAATPERTAEIIAFFTVPTMGLHPEKAEAAIGSVSDVLTFLSTYESPAFPGPIDAEAARRGADVYTRCAMCHGEYVERDGRLRLQKFPNRLSPLAEIGTDPARVDAVTAEIVAAVNDSTMGEYIDAKETRGYVAPSLAGLWATAPYLHNGSVPTLAALLSPVERPTKFQVGGHKLDFLKVGIAGEMNTAGEYAYSPGYLPWAAPRMFDTSRAGHSNRGHEKEFEGLSPNQKSDLIEFLKRL